MTRTSRAAAARRTAYGIWPRAPGVPWNHSTARPPGAPYSANARRRPSRSSTWPSPIGEIPAATPRGPDRVPRDLRSVGRELVHGLASGGELAALAGAPALDELQ